jgi:ATP-binding cassette subfamily F protein uup
LDRLDRQLAALADQEAAVNAEIAAHAHDYERLTALSAHLEALMSQRAELEEQWLEAAEHLG